ncbi:proliferation marker protein Ki-67 [Erethizon dorsatum]
MGSTARLVTIKRNGVDGIPFPLTLSTCLFGRGTECDIRIQLPVVSKQHCKIEINKQEAILYNFSSTNPTQVNGSAIDKPVPLRHGDIITIIDRSFRYENESYQNRSKTPEFPEKKREQKSAWRTSRASFSADPDKNEDVSLKRRRVSFGGHLRPELFDENLPPNTPLKRGETPVRRKSVGTHTPAVLKKIIKEQPQSPEKEDSSEICLEVKAQNVSTDALAPSPRVTPARTNDQRRRSLKASTASSDGKSPLETDMPKKAGRKSGHLPSKRASISRSQHDILQMISSKRRSGASEANLIVAKSWADVVKLGVKQTQTKVVKHAPPRQMTKRQRRPNTPKKASDSVRNQCSTGHANSPCTIVIGKVHIEKANAPARPYRMLNNFVFNQKMDYSEDLSGLSEMFKTPVKEKPQMMSTCSATLSNSENLLGKKAKVISSGEESLPIPSVNLGENVYFSAQNAAKEPSDKCFASPVLRRKYIKEDEKIVKTPGNIHKITHFEIKTPDSATEPLKTVCSTNKLRRSVELRKMQMLPIESKNEEVGITENITGKNLRKTTLQEKEKERERRDRERSLETCKENVESNENSAKIATERRSRSGGKKYESTGDLTGLKRTPEREPTEHISGTQILLQKTDCAKESTNEVGITTKMPCKSSQPEPIHFPTSRKRQLKTPLGKVDVKEEVPALRKLSQISGEYIHIVDYDKSMEAFMETPKQKLDSAIYATGMKRWPRSPKKIQPPEDLLGIKELFQTPEHIDEPISEYKAKVPRSSPHTEAVDTPRRKKTVSNTPRRKVDVKEEKAMHTLKGTEGEGKSIKTFKESAEQTLDLATNISGSKRWPRTPKVKAQSLEDLTGFQELFQTPSHAKDSVSEQEIPKTPRGSSQSGPVDTSTTSKRRSKTNMGKTEGKEELSTPRKLTQSPGRTTHTPTVPIQEKKGTRASMQTPKQKLDLTENLTEFKRPARNSKTKTQPLEDLTGFQELFQTPSHAKDSVSEQEIPKTPRGSSQSGPVDTSTTSKRRSKTNMGKTEGKEELSTPRKLTQSPGRTTHTPTVPIQEKKGIRASMQTPKQKLDLTENLTEFKRPARNSKTKTQPLEDLTGFQELFQTPSHAKDSVSEQEIPKTPRGSSQSGPVDTSTTSKRRSKANMGKTEGKEELSTPRKLTQSPGRTMHTPTVPIQEKKGTRASMQTPKQKLDLTENLTEFKRPARNSKTKTQPLEDLTGFQELFQTPSHAKDSVSEQEIPKTPRRSSQSGPIDTSTTSKRRSKTNVGKTEGKEELSTPRKLTQSPGRTMHTPTVPVQEKKGIRAMQTPKQKLDLTENLTEFKRPARNSKTKTQPLEDLTGFQELFRTPSHAKDSVSEQEIPKTPRRSSQSGPIDTSTTSKRRSKTNVGKTEGKEELSTPRKLTQSPGRTMHTPTVPIQEKKGIRAMQTSKQKLDLTENLTEFKRPAQNSKTKTQPLEDLTGFQELFRTPSHAKDSVTEQEIPKTPHRSSQSGPANTSTTSKRHSKISLGKIDGKEEHSAPRKLAQSPGRTMHTTTVPIQDRKDIRASMQSPKQKMDLTENLTELRRPTRTPKTKAQPLEDLAGFQELFQTPGHSKNPITTEETPRTPFRSPQPMPVGTPTPSKRRSKISIGKVDMEEELSSHNEVTQLPGKAVHTPLIPVQEKGIRTSTETPKQKLDQTENLAGLERWLQTPKTKAQPLKDLAGFQELFQTSGHAKDPLASEKTTRLLSRSPQPGPVDVQQLSLVRELTQMSEKTMYAPKVKVDGGDKSICCVDSAEQALDPATNESGGRRQQRTTKVKPQLLEDLTGFQELFQTPGDAKDLMTAGETTKMPCTSPHPGLLRTSPALNRHPRTSLGIVDMKEVLSAPGKLTKSPGKALHIPLVPVQEEKSIRASTETPEQKLNPRENLNGLKRQPRTPKEKACVLEDLSGFQELFRTPGHANDPITPDETTKMPCRFTQPGPLNTSATSKRCPKTSLGKADRKEMSALRKLTQITGKAMHTSRVLEGDDKVFKDIVDQTLIPAAAGNKRRSRKRKEEVPPLEDLAGFQELFQTPGHAKDPISIDETAKMPCVSLQTESVDTPTRVVRQSTTSWWGGNVKEHLAVINLTQTSGKIAHTHEEPADYKESEVFKKSTKRKLDPAESVTGSKRLRGESKKNTQSLEDLTGFKELFQTPGHTEESASDEQTTEMPCKSQPESADTPRRKKALPSTPREKKDMKEKQVVHTPKAAEDGDKAIKAFKESSEQTLDLAANVSGSREWPGIPKIKAQVLEDLTAFQELFQTPDCAKDPVTTDETTKMPCISQQPGPLYTPTTSKRHSKTSLGKTDLKKELSSLRRQMQSPGRAMHTPPVPAQEQEGIRAATEIPKQKLTPRENLNGLKRQPRTPEEKAYVLEDLSGFQELFQTPGHVKDPITENLTGLGRQRRTPKAKTQLLEDLSGLQELFQTPGHHSSNSLTEDETPKTPCRSPQSPPMDPSTASKRHSKISLGKIDLREELSSLRKLTRSPGATMHTPLVPVQEQEGIRASTGTPKQKLALKGNITGLKRCPQTPKTKAQPLEDLAGFQELFQTPDHAKDPVTAVKTPCRTQSTPVATLTTSKRCPKTSVGKMDVKGELSMVRERTLRETMYTHKEARDDKDNKVFKESAKRKLDAAENVTGTKRLRRAPKIKTQTLEDLGGLQELFQMPGHTEESMSDEKATVMPYKSPQPEPVRTPTNTKRCPRKRLRKVKEDSSAVQKPTQISRAITHTSEVPEGNDKGIKPLKELEKKTPDLAADVSGSKRWPRAAKAKAQPLQDLTGSRELSQTLGHTEESARDEKTTEMPCKSPQVPGDTSATSKRRPRTRFGKVDVTEELSAQRKQTGTSGETVDTHKEPTSDSKITKEFKESAKRKLDQEENVTGSKRLRGTRKEKTQLLEDLAGFKELIQKSAYTEESLRSEKTTKMPCKSSQPEPVDTPTSTKRRLRRRLGNVNVKEGLSVVRKPIRISRATTHTSKMLEGDDKDIKAFKDSSEQTLDPATSVRSNRRYLRASKAKLQVQDLPSPKEISQTPDHTEEQINDVHSLKSTLQQIPDSAKPLKSFRRVRVPKEKPIEDLVDTKDPTASQNGMSLRTRHQNKNGVNQQRLEIPTSEKAKIKRREKSMKTSKETEQQNPDDGAGKPASKGKVSGKRICLRSGRQSKNSELHIAEEDVNEKSMDIPVKNQKEKEVTKNSDTMSLRSRRAKIKPKGNTLKSDSEQRVTRSAKRCAENPKKDKDIVDTNKIRTRSHQNVENI